MTLFNPLDKFYKSQTGAVCANKKLTLRVKGNFNSVVLLLKKDGETNSQTFNLQAKDGYFETVIKIDIGLYFYCFSVGENKFIGLGEGYQGEITSKPIWFQLMAFDQDYSVPDWIKGGVIYQIFPDRFCRFERDKNIDCDKILHDNWLDTPTFEPNKQGKVLNNDFFGGDLKGIISKLDYIQSLGVNVIYLNPIFKAYSNHRYDTGDYMSIDPLLGSLDDFKNLISCAKEKGIKIILDGVFNHTGDDSLYFNKYGKYDSLGAYQSKDSKYYSWYNFINYPNKYDAWWGIDILPAVNESNPDYVEFITGKGGVIDFYTNLGIGGWRLDVVDELPSCIVEKIRSSAKKVNNESIVIGEVWEDASNKVSYGVRRKYFQGKELDSVMNYPLKDAIVNFVKYKDSKGLSNLIKEQIDHYPTFVLHALMNILSTHDTFRLINALCGEDVNGKSKAQMANITLKGEKYTNAKFLVKVASLLQFTLCGVPSIYYGDEIGMQGYTDPLNRKCYPWGFEDCELLDWYKFLGSLRHDYDAFVDGEYVELYSEEGAFVYKRCGKNSEVLIAVNIGNKSIELSYADSLYNLIDDVKYCEKYLLKEQSVAVFIKK